MLTIVACWKYNEEGFFMRISVKGTLYLLAAAVTLISAAQAAEELLHYCEKNRFNHSRDNQE
jgi:hypothetical protein